VKEVYKHFCDHLEDLRANEGSVLSKLRDEPLFLNINDDEESLNWVKGSSLAIGCNIRGGYIQGVRASLCNFGKFLEAAGALAVHRPSYVREHDKNHFESGISSTFDQLRGENTLTDVVFRVEPTEDVPNPEPLFAHRTFLAVSSEFFRKNLCVDSQESRNVSMGSPLDIKVNYSWQCVRSFLGEYYLFFVLTIYLILVQISSTVGALEEEVYPSTFYSRFLTFRTYIRPTSLTTSRLRSSDS